MKKYKLNINNKGFTLLETIVALAIISGVLVTVLGSLNYHIKVVIDNEVLVTAAFLGKDKMEEMNLIEVIDFKSKEGTFEDIGDNYKDYNWKFNVTQHTDYETLENIVLSVFYKEDEVYEINTFKIAEKKK